MWVRGKASLCFLSLFSSFMAAQKNRCGNSHKCQLCPFTRLYTEFHVFFFFFLLTSQTFCHHLILKLERKGMEERIANMRGFWKFPFYGT